MAFEHLSSAPIKEAIIEFCLKGRLKPEDLESLGEELPDGYCDYRPVLHREIGFSFKDGEIKRESDLLEKTVGFRADNNTDKTVVVFEINKFRFIKLAPYTNWDDFMSEAMSMWDIYKRKHDDIAFTRIAVRYLNEIRLPLADRGLDFDDYLTICPTIPNGMPDMLARFLSKVTVPCEEEHAMAAITLNSEDVRDGELPIILDIDVFRSSALELTEKELWASIGVLRNVKNMAFFGSITDKTRSLCK